MAKRSYLTQPLSTEPLSTATIRNTCTKCRHSHESTKQIPTQSHATIQNAIKLLGEFIKGGYRTETCTNCQAYCEATIHFDPVR